MQLINALMLLIFLSQISTNNGVQVQKEGPCGTPSQLLTEVKITPKLTIFFQMWQTGYVGRKTGR